MVDPAPKAVAEVAPLNTSSAPHQNPASVSQPNAHPQKKAKDKKIFSCHSCRRRKLKCDRSDPCGACHARGEGHLCTWEEGQRPEKSKRENLEQLPKLIEKLAEEVKELKSTNLALMDNIRFKPTESWLDQTSFAQGVRQSHSEGGINSPRSLSRGPDLPHRNPDCKPWGPSQATSLLPESRLLRSLISQYIRTFASLTGFIDVKQLVSSLEVAERVRQQGRGELDSDTSSALPHFNLHVALILACASLGAVDLDPAQAQELGIGSSIGQSPLSIDELVKDLWTRARSLITTVDVDPFSAPLTEPHVSAATVVGGVQGPYAEFLQQEESGVARIPSMPLHVVAVKIVLLLAARSFATPSVYLKLHLDLISSAVEAGLDSPSHADMPLMDQEWQWQLWSFLCVLDWTSPGIYHNGSYFIRAEMYRDPPSTIPGVPDDAAYSSITEGDHRDRLSRTRYYLEYALTLAHLSRWAEDYIIRPGAIPPDQAAKLCAELDALDTKLTCYQILGSRAGGRGAQTPPPKAATTAGADKLSVTHLSISRMLQVQNAYLNLELGLIRFKLFRHEAFHLIHDASPSSSPLRTMCMDACMDACIIVLSQCRAIASGDLSGHGSSARSVMSTEVSDEEKRTYVGTLRRVLQPASSAALVGQVLLHALRAEDRLTPETAPISSASLGNTAAEFFSFVERGTDMFPAYPSANRGGNADSFSGWSKRLSREKVRVLQFHISTMTWLLEQLQATSPLAKYKYDLQGQCM